MFLMRTISSCFSSWMVRRCLAGSSFEPPRISRNMLATRLGVALSPGRPGSSSTPSRRSRMPFSIFFASIFKTLSASTPFLSLFDKLRERQREDSLHGNPFLPGDFDAIGEFGLGVDLAAAQRRDLDADGLAQDPD